MLGETMPKRTINIGKSGKVTATEKPYECEVNKRKESDKAAKAAWETPKPEKEVTTKKEVVPSEK